MMVPLSVEWSLGRDLSLKYFPGEAPASAHVRLVRSARSGGDTLAHSIKLSPPEIATVVAALQAILAGAGEVVRIIDHMERLHALDPSPFTTHPSTLPG